MRPYSLWILSLGFVALAVPAHATPRDAEEHEMRHARQARHDHATNARTNPRVGERETLTIRWKPNGRTARFHRQLAMRVRNDDLAKAFSEADQPGRSIVPRRSAQQSFSVLPVLPGRWREQIDASTISSRRFDEDGPSSPTPRILPVSETSATPVPEPTAALLFGGGLVLVYTLAARRRERV